MRERCELSVPSPNRPGFVSMVFWRCLGSTTEVARRFDMMRLRLGRHSTTRIIATSASFCVVGKPESAGINRHVVGDARARAAMLADVPVGESPIGGSAQLPP